MKRHHSSGGHRRSSTLCKPALSALPLTAALAAAGAVAEGSRELNEVIVSADLTLSRETSIGKMDIPLTETPFSVSLRSREFMDAIGAKTVQDALQHFAGVSGGTYGIDVRGDWSKVRGVDPVIFIDGLQSIFGSYTSSRANHYAFERVEILKGPSSVLYGQGSTGGIVNLVSKRPREEFEGEMRAEVGSYDRKVAAGDITGALDDDGHWLYRIVGYKRDADAQVEHTDDNSTLLMPSLSWRPDEDTEITLLASFQDDESGTTAAFLPWGGTRIHNENGRLPTDTFISEPGWDKYDTRQKNYGLWIQHRFNPVWSLNANARYADGEVDYNSMWLAFGPERFDPDIRTGERTLYMSDATSEFLIYDIRATAEFDTGPLEHLVAFGVDSQDATTRKDTLFLFGQGGTIDLFDPVYTGVPAGLTPPRGPEVTTEQLGFYIQDQINLDNWVVNLGARRDDVESQSGSDPTKGDEATSLRFGLMYAFEAGVSPYISYSESFEPISGADRLDRPFDPVEGEQVEAGVKYQPPGTKLLFTAATYEIKQKNRTTPDPVNPAEQTQTGEVTIDGVELEFSGRWDNLSLIANYSTTNTEVTSSNVPGEEDNPLHAVPEEQFSLWGTWHFSDRLAGLYASLGVRHVGESFTGIQGDPVFPDTNPAYTLYDAALGYETGDWKFQINASNLTDEVHTTSCLPRGDCFYGERRYLTAEARYSF